MIFSHSTSPVIIFSNGCLCKNKNVLAAKRLKTLKICCEIVKKKASDKDNEMEKEKEKQMNVDKHFRYCFRIHTRTSHYI